jgi:hypothetical protein
MRLSTALAAVLALALFASTPLLGQAVTVEAPAPEAASPELTAPQALPETVVREAHHLNTIGTYSAGFVLQSYGYIGVLADVFSQQIYEPDVVRSMLGETITYLNNARNQLLYYQSPDVRLPKADLDFIDGISNIINDLVLEAEALSAFTESLQESDLLRFQDARQKAWTKIKRLLGVK